MNLSLDMIHSILNMNSAHIVSSCGLSTQHARLRAAALWAKDMPIQEDLCYVAMAQHLKPGFHCPTHMTLIVVGAVDSSLLQGYDADVLVLEVPPKRSIFCEYYNRISQIFYDYQNWTLQLNAALVKNPSLQEIVTTGEKLFHNPILVFDRNFGLLNRMSPAVKMDWVVNGRTHEKMLSSEMIDIIKTYSGYQSASAEQHTFFISSEYLPYNTFFSHVSKGNAIFTLAILEVTAPLRGIQEQMVQYFAECVYSVLCKNNFHTGHSLRFEAFLKELLSDKQVEQAVIDQHLLPRHWLNAENYLCFTFEINWWDKVNSVYHSICLNIENAFPHSFAFFYDDRIVTIVNLDKAGLSRDGLIQKLSLFLREQMLHVGVSYTFFDFSTLSSYYKQTLATLEMGHLHHPDQWCYKFEDYVLPYFMRYGTTQIHGRHLCHPGLVQLWLYDFANKTELLTTLQMYLTTGRNATLTAKNLFIHRNTLYQRLDKITQLLDADLNDPNTRLFMMMSYSFVELLNLKPIEEVLAARPISPEEEAEEA